MVETERYVRKPIYVEAVQVTELNFFEVAMWCQGEIFPQKAANYEDLKHKYIQIAVHSPRNERQKQAHVGDWVLKTDQGLKIYQDGAFRRNWDPTGEDVVQAVAVKKHYHGANA